MAHSNLPTTAPVLPLSPVELTLDTSNLVLTTLSNAARMTHVSVLQGIAALALNIVEIAQNARSNKNAFQRLASDTCALVYVVARYGYKVEASGANVTSEYLEYMKELSETLQEIHKVTKAQVSKNKFLCIAQSKSDAGVIQEYRDRLRQSLDVFGLKSSISIHESLASISERLDLFADRKEAKQREMHEQSEEAASHKEQIAEARESYHKDTSGFISGPISVAIAETAEQTRAHHNEVLPASDLYNQFAEHKQRNEEVFLLLKDISVSIFILLLTLLFTNPYLSACTQP